MAGRENLFLASLLAAGSQQQYSGFLGLREHRPDLSLHLQMGFSVHARVCLPSASLSVSKFPLFIRTPAILH